MFAGQACKVVGSKTRYDIHVFVERDSLKTITSGMGSGWLAIQAVLFLQISSICSAIVMTVDCVQTRSRRTVARTDSFIEMIIDWVD